MEPLFSSWRSDPFVILVSMCALWAYFIGARRYRIVRGRYWPAGRSCWFAVGILSGFLAIESPLDAAGDIRFAPHMVQHLVLTDITAPCVLLGGPLLLVLSTAPNGVARRIVALVKSVGRFGAFPVFTWLIFIVTLWVLHFSGFFEAALESEFVHVIEHVSFTGTAILFWLPVITVGPALWSDTPLAFPLRMLYLLIAMPAEGMLGFTLNGARHILYPRYASAGLRDQQAAGEIMWIGSTLCMFVAFMVVGFGWAEHDRRAGERANSRVPSA